MKKTYILNPNMTFKSVNSTVASDKPAEAAVCRLPPKAVWLPPRQPLHTVTVDRNRPAIKLGLDVRSEEHTSELQSQSNLVCRLLLEKKKKKNYMSTRAMTVRGRHNI